MQRQEGGEVHADQVHVHGAVRRFGQRVVVQFRVGAPRLDGEVDEAFPLAVGACEQGGDVERLVGAEVGGVPEGGVAGRPVCRVAVDETRLVALGGEVGGGLSAHFVLHVGDGDPGAGGGEFGGGCVALVRVLASV